MNLEQAQAMRHELQEARKRSQAERDQAFEEKKARQRKEKLYRLLDELGEPSQQTFTIYQLNQFGTEAIEPLIETLLTNRNPHARYGSIKVLKQICYEHEIKALTKAKVAKVLIKTLADSESKIRQQAARMLGEFKGRPGQLAVEPLGALLNDPQPEVRQQAQQSLQKIGGKRAQEILDKPKGFMGWLKGD